MVPRLCVIIINCVFFVNFWRYPAKRPTLESSSAASISSRRQNGEGFRFWIAKRSAMAVSAFSPPESCIMFWSFFPGGWEMIRIPASRISSSSASSRVPRPPPNSSLKALSNSFWISPNFSLNCFRMPSSNSWMICSSVFSASKRSLYWPLKNVCRSRSSL